MTGLSRLLVGCLATLAACAPALRAPEGEPYLTGAVESITHSATGSGISVAGPPGGCGIVARADAATRYLARDAAGALREATVAELETGQRVQVFVDGPVTRSCPARGRATVIVRLP